MKFTCLPIHGLTVIIEPGRTIYQGPHDKQNVMGTEVVFTHGFFEIDATYPSNLDLVKRLLKHASFNRDFRYVPEPIKVMVGGRAATLEGYSLEEAIAFAEEACEARIAGKELPVAPAPQSNVLNTDPLSFFDAPTTTAVGPSISTGAANSKTMQPAPAQKVRKGPPGGKFVKQPAIATPAN